MTILLNTRMLLNDGIYVCIVIKTIAIVYDGNIINWTLVSLNSNYSVYKLRKFV